MKYQTELSNAENLESQGKNIEAAKAYQDVGTKCLREGGEEERKVASKIIAKSIARYILAGQLTNAQDLAFQVLHMKEEDPFLSLQIETAITTKHQVVRAFFIDKHPKEINENYETFKKIPQNRKILKINRSITVKQMWEWTLSGEFRNKYDLQDQTFSNPREMINFILSTTSGVNVITAETNIGEKILAIIAITYNIEPVEVIDQIK